VNYIQGDPFLVMVTADVKNQPLEIEKPKDKIPTISTLTIS